MKKSIHWLNTELTFVILCMSLSTCQFPERPTNELPHQITPAFYHWKTVYKPTQSEKEELKRLHITKLYIHFFDVDWDTKTSQPIPKALVQFRQKPGSSVVPVVFITNRTLLNLSSAHLPELATHITQALMQISKTNAIHFPEVQFDCDWSTQTRDRYFKLLTLLNQQFKCPLSATIRLHQIKFTDQMGIPPVARGMLMLYNVADWKRADTHNSFYDSEVVNQYLSFVSTYPLPLDVVMPLFRWTVVYRNNRFLTFLNNMTQKTLASCPFLSAQPDSARFLATRDTTAFGFSIRQGDLFRAEAVSSETLLAEKVKIARQIQGQRLTFALYHLDSTILSTYSRETLQSLFRP